VRVVADTNVVISGLLWKGPPSRILEAAKAGAVRLYSSTALLDELEGVLLREKFSKRLEAAALDPGSMVKKFREGIILVAPVSLGPVIIEDPDDDVVIACAMAAGAEAIVSGDPHLLALKIHEGIPILTPTALLDLIGWS
jgi:uncharacterized protein